VVVSCFFLWRGDRGLNLVVAVLPEVAVWHEQEVRDVDSRLAVHAFYNQVGRSSWLVYVHTDFKMLGLWNL
jgi:hypothetical protein